MQKKIRVGAVSYLNTKPLIYAFERGEMSDQIELLSDYPSRLSGLLQKDKIDIALLPVASLSSIQHPYIFSDFCIASHNKVASVCLYSQVPIHEVQQVYLDYQSRTSVALFKILIRDYWHIRPLLLEADQGYIEKIAAKTAGIIIGDRALEQLSKFPFVYDLSEAWYAHTQLPFVFATWVSNKKLSEDFIEQFNKANAQGLNHIDEIISMQPEFEYDLRKYYTENIFYRFNAENKKGMQLFLKMTENL